MAAKTYTALDPIRHDGVDYAPGASIDLDDEAAGPLLAAGAIAEPASPADAAPSAPPADEPPPGGTVVPIGTKAGKAKSAK